VQVERTDGQDGLGAGGGGIVARLSMLAVDHVLSGISEVDEFDFIAIVVREHEVSSSNVSVHGRIRAHGLSGGH